MGNNANEVELEFCLRCKKPNPPEREICECGSRNFVYGNNFSLKDGGVHCDCGSTSFNMVLHTNSNPSRYVYKCSNCNNVIKKEYYKENEDYFY